MNLPYIFKDRVRLNDFSRHGYQAYECKNLCNIYTQDFINIASNPNIGEAALNAWRMGRKRSGKELDPMAPENLVVCFGNPPTNSSWEGKEAIFWNYDENSEPEPIHPDTGAAAKDAGVIFQDIKNSQELCCNLAQKNDDTQWDGITESVRKCFEVANRYGIYFFLMKPLRDLDKDKIIAELYEPLLQARNGLLTPEDKQGLIRFGQEFGFDWSANHIDIDK